MSYLQQDEYLGWLAFTAPGTVGTEEKEGKCEAMLLGKQIMATKSLKDSRKAGNVSFFGEERSIWSVATSVHDNTSRLVHLPKMIVVSGKSEAMGLSSRNLAGSKPGPPTKLLLCPERSKGLSPPKAPADPSSLCSSMSRSLTSAGKNMSTIAVDL